MSSDAEGLMITMEQIVSDIVNESVDHSILSRLKLKGAAGCALSRGWEETYYGDEQCWYSTTDQDDLRTDPPTVRLMAAEELISELGNKFVDQALEALFEMLHDPYEQHRSHPRSPRILSSVPAQAPPKPCCTPLARAGAPRRPRSRPTW